MTDSSYTHILAVVDRSGSMFGTHTDMIGALDSFFNDQKALEGRCLVDYVQFDDNYELVFENKDVSKAKAVLVPRGSTALLDAVGRSVTDLGKKFADMDEDKRPGTVIVVVITDGMENASRDWNANTVKELIKKQESEYNWDFTFLGANMDAVAVGAGFGFDPDKSLTYSTGNTVAMSAALSSKTTRTRSGLLSSYTDEERASQV